MAVVLSLVMGTLLAGQRPEVGSLNVGDTAPGFSLRVLRTRDSFELKSNFGKRPTVLVFGSYT